MDSELPAGFRVSIAADPDGVARATKAFGDFAEDRAVADAVRRPMAVALDELLTNAVSYGGDTQRDIVVEVELHADRMIIALTDSGGPFDPIDQPAPDTSLSVDARPLGGLGLHLVRHLVDDISYQRRADRNVIVLTKRL